MIVTIMFKDIEVMSRRYSAIIPPPPGVTHLVAQDVLLTFYFSSRLFCVDKKFRMCVLNETLIHTSTYFNLRRNYL